MKRSRTTIWLLFAVLLFGRCSKPSCFEDAGPLTTTTRSATPFHRIELYNDINLVLTQDTVEAIRVEANERLLPNISTTIENGVLTLRNTTTCNWLRDPANRITVYVSVKKLDHVLYQGSGNVRSTNTLKADTITLYSSTGAGVVDIDLEAAHTVAVIEYESADFVLRGRSNTCYSYTNARGSINFEAFAVNVMTLRYAGVRNTVIRVSDQLDAVLYHTGNVYYTGEPRITHTQYYSTGRLYAQP